MERRLKLAKQLLNPNDSVLIVTIDEKEYARLGLLLERIYPGSRIQMVSSVINPAGVARQGEFARSDEYIYFVYFGEAGPKKVPLGDDWLGGVNNSCKGKLHWNSLMRTGTNSLRSDRPNLFYPIYVKEDGGKIDHIGASLSRDESREDVPSCPGCKTVWPIRTNGAEGNWQISQAALRVALEKGFVKLGRFTERGMAISYLKSGEQKKVESGLFPIIGRRADGSVIVDDSNYEANYIPSTQWRIGIARCIQKWLRYAEKNDSKPQLPFPKVPLCRRGRYSFLYRQQAQCARGRLLFWVGHHGTCRHAPEPPRRRVQALHQHHEQRGLRGRGKKAHQTWFASRRSRLGGPGHLPVHYQATRHGGHHGKDARG